MQAPPSSPPLFLGIDAGGTSTRWALADAQGSLQREGAVAGLSALQLHDEAGLADLQQTLQTLARDCAAAGAVQAVLAGVTGLDDAQRPRLGALLAQALGLATTPLQVQVISDIALACRAAPEAYVVYAGTGSIAAFIDATGALQRAGGRGAVIDDAGGGHWIAREALRRIWRAEDEAPGAWRDSALAQRVFELIGGSDWAQTRQWVYGATRGELGTLALAVAQAAHESTKGRSRVDSPPRGAGDVSRRPGGTQGDAAALALLREAGSELARLARALLQRHGPRPLQLAGRVFDLHPCIAEQLRQELPAQTVWLPAAAPAHHAAARLASQQTKGEAA